MDHGLGRRRADAHQFIGLPPVAAPEGAADSNARGSAADAKWRRRRHWRPVVCRASAAPRRLAMFPSAGGRRRRRHREAGVQVVGVSPLIQVPPSPPRRLPDPFIRPFSPRHGLSTETKGEVFCAIRRAGGINNQKGFGCAVPSIESVLESPPRPRSPAGCDLLHEWR
nr:unnamed protein product [Digitaria exilis]